MPIKGRSPMPDNDTFHSSPLISRIYHNGRDTSYKPPPSPLPGSSFPYDRMASPAGRNRGGLGITAGRYSKKYAAVITASYILDWLILIAVGLVGYKLGNITPNKRPFSLENPDISFPFTEHETVTSTTLVLCSAGAPIILILIISLLFVPGSTVPKGTPKSLIWQRKLWELHAGWQGLALSLIAAWFITNGMKNLFGKPRPDLIARCQPDLANLSQYIVGGIANVSSNGQLVSADICKNTDTATLDDGFRSYPSGHSSSAAAGLIYLSLFIASKFAITFPFLAPAGYADASSFTAFPSRLRASPSGLEPEAYELQPTRSGHADPNQALASPHDPQLHRRLAQHNLTVAAARRQAAAPPVYLLVVAVIPFFAAIFIASSRWFDFRHHGFDILFGFLIGTITAFFAFHWYHLPLSQGTGWAWGPRSADKAFWAGVGSFSYATDSYGDRPGDEEAALGGGAYLHVSEGYGNGHKVTGSGGSAVGRVPHATVRGDEGESTAYVGAGGQ